MGKTRKADETETFAIGSEAESTTYSAGSDKPRRRRASRLDIEHGDASMRAYPVTQFELWALGAVGLATSIAFSVATGLLNFIIDTRRDLNLTPDITEQQRLYWELVASHACYGMVAALILGVLLALGGGLAILKIIGRTNFPSE